MDIPLLDHFFGLKINPLIIFLILLPLFSALISGCFLATVIFLRLRSERVTPKEIVDAIRALRPGGNTEALVRLCVRNDSARALS